MAEIEEPYEGQEENDRAEAFAARPPGTLAEAAEMTALMKELYCWEPGDDSLLARMIASLDTSIQAIAAQERPTAAAA